MYKVIKFFTDLKDHDHAYRVGDIFPRKGLTVSEERLKELSTNLNKRGTPLIKEVKEEEPENASEGEIKPDKEEHEENIAEETKEPKKSRKSKK